MKQTFIALIILLPLLTSGGDSIDPFASRPAATLSESNKTHTFRVSQVGSDKTELLAVYAAVNESGVSSKIETFDTTNFEIAIRVSSTEFIVHPKRLSTVHINKGNRLGQGGQTTSFRRLSTDRDELFLLITKTPKTSVEDDSLADIIAVETGEIAERDDYRRTLGYRALRILREVNRGELSKEEFVARLRSGETWLLKNFKTEKCRTCMGTGRLGKLSDYAQCANCRGKGGFSVDYLVKW